MTYKIITSKGEIFDTDFEILNNELTLEPTIASFKFLDFVNKNYSDIALSENSKQIYNELWDQEEQFKIFVLDLTKIN